VTRLLTALACSVALTGSAFGATAAYPTKVVRVVVPFPPGAGNDIVTRIVMPRLSESTGQSFVVDNRGGAGGIIGTELAARAAPDGYTLYVGGSALILTPLTSKVPYKAEDFLPIARFASVPFILVVNPAMPAKSLADLVVIAKARPGSINYASTGHWTTPHLTTELFRAAAKIDITHVPYNGSALALTNLLGGHIDMFFCNMLSATPHIGSGKLQALAVSSPQRSPVTPQVPTVAESGYPGFETVTWFGLMAPVGTPGGVAATLHAQTAKALRRPDVQEQLAAQGATVILEQGPEGFAAYLRSETDKWSRLLKTLDAGKQ
jgi:tripartite-type tricarboxylate transporter receptor subunit TctC